MESIYEDFFAKAKKIKEKMEFKKLRGLNDFNIFTTLLSSDDEARVHSRFIHSLLDIRGEHYQKELFLELFIKCCDLEKFGLDIKKTIAYTEYEHIDIYLTDGNKHIIIENKIYASEQKHQTKRYIEKIARNNVSGKNICVLYLSKNIDYPSQYSLEKFYLCDDFTHLEYSDKNNSLANLGKIKFKSIHYNNEILKWINFCLDEVSNLTNLYVIINQYKNTINLLYGKYEGVKMKLRELMKENYSISSEIADNFLETKKEIINNFLKEVKDKLEKKLGEYWVVNINKIHLKRREIPFDIVPKNHSKHFVFFALEFESRDLTYPYLGLRISDNALDGREIRQKLQFLQKENWKTTKWFLHWQWVGNDNDIDDDFAKNIGSSLTVDGFSETIIDLVNQFEDVALEVNSNIDEYIQQ